MMPTLPPNWNWVDGEAVGPDFVIKSETVDETASRAWVEWERVSGLKRADIDSPALTFAGFQEFNYERATSKVFASCHDWMLADWGNALAGEVGEACNIIKKMKRDPHGTVTVEQLANELADVVTYAAIIASKIDVDLGEAVIRKFNIVSERRGSDMRL